MSIDGRVAVLGVGTMGEAILKGLRSGDHPVPASRLRGTVRGKSRAQELTRRLRVRIGTDNVHAVREASVVVVCLKPMNVLRVLRELAEAGALEHAPLVLSVAAGVSTQALESVVGKSPVVRAMPNTPCAIGKGTTVLTGGARAKKKHLQTAHRIFQPLGESLELDEKHFDTVTGLSGSGPAFAYLMVESLADGGVMMGLPRDVAVRLAARTLLGASEMVLATGSHPAALKDDVTTPAGCTIAGILALEDGRIRSTLARAVEKAAACAAGLGNSER